MIWVKLSKFSQALLLLKKVLLQRETTYQNSFDELPLFHNYESRAIEIGVSSAISVEVDGNAIN